MSSAEPPDVSAPAITVTIPEALRWTATRRGAYVSFPVPDRVDLTALVDAAAGRAAELWAAHRGLGRHPAHARQLPGRGWHSGPQG